MSYNQFSFAVFLGIIGYTLFLWFVIRLCFSNILYKDKQLGKYFNIAFFLKIGAGIAFTLMYEYIYQWMGDTFYYYSNSCHLSQTLWTSPSSYFKILFDLVDNTNIASVDTTFYNPLRYKGNASGLYNIHRFLSPFAILGLRNYYLMCVVANSFFFVLNFKVFLFILKQINVSDKYRRITFISFLCIPSALLFSSGLVKDSFCYTFSSLMVVYLYKLFFLRKISIGNIIKFLFCFYILYSLKPYLLFVFFGSFLLWWGFSLLHHVKNVVLRFAIFPTVMILLFVSLLYGSQFLGTLLGGKYSSIDSMVQSAAMSQYDLKQDYYQGHAFDIGEYSDIEGMISLSPLAIVAGLFRPFLWEARNMGMFFSGVENTIILFLTLYILFIIGPKYFIPLIKNNLFLSFCLLVSIMLSFSIGITTSNFGALVRFKIPLLPFLFYALLFIWKSYQIDRKELSKKSTSN